MITTGTDKNAGFKEKVDKPIRLLRMFWQPGGRVFKHFAFDRPAAGRWNPSRPGEFVWIS